MKNLFTLCCTLCAIVASVPCWGAERRVPINNPFRVNKAIGLKMHRAEKTTTPIQKLDAVNLNLQELKVADLNQQIPEIVDLNLQKQKTVDLNQQKFEVVDLSHPNAAKFYAPQQEQMVDVVSHYNEKTESGEATHKMKYNNLGFLEENVLDNGTSVYKYAYSGIVNGKWTKKVYTEAASPKKIVEERTLDQAERVVLREDTRYTDSTQTHPDTKRVYEYSYDHDPNGICVKDVVYRWNDAEQKFAIIYERYLVWFNPLKKYLQFYHSDFSISADGLSIALLDNGSYTVHYYNEQGEKIGYLNAHTDNATGEFTSVYGSTKQVIKNKPQSGWNTMWTYEATLKPGATDIHNCVEWNIVGKSEFTEGYYNKANVQIGKTEKSIEYKGDGLSLEIISQNEWTYVTNNIMKVTEWDNIEGIWEGWEYYENGTRIGEAILFDDNSYMVIQTEDNNDETKYYTHYAADGTILTKYSSFTDTEIFPNSSLTSYYGLDRFRIFKNNQWYALTGNLIIGNQQTGSYLSLNFDGQGRPLERKTYKAGKMTSKDEYVYTDKTYNEKNYKLSADGVLYQWSRTFMEVKNNSAIFLEREDFESNGVSSYRSAELCDATTHIKTSYHDWNETLQRYMQEYKSTLVNTFVNERGENVTINYTLQGDVAVPNSMTESLRGYTDSLYIEIQADYTWDAANQKWKGISKTNKGHNIYAFLYQYKNYISPLYNTYTPTDYFSLANEYNEWYRKNPSLEEWDYSFAWYGDQWVLVRRLHKTADTWGNTLNMIEIEQNDKKEYTYVLNERGQLIRTDELKSIGGRNEYLLRREYNYDEKDRPKSEHHQLYAFTTSGIMNLNQFVLREYFYTSIASDVEDLTADQPWSIQGKTINSNAPMKVYDLSGRLVMQIQNGSAQLPASGIYMINCNGQTSKVMVK